MDGDKVLLVCGAVAQWTEGSDVLGAESLRT
jgi:hypothetical protein